MHKPLVVNIHRAAVGIGVVIVNERSLHAAILYVNAAAVAYGVIFLNNAVGKECVFTFHVNTRAPIGLKLL